MKSSILLLAGLLFLLTTEAQRGPLQGSGKLVEKKYDYSGFDKLSIRDLNGRVSIQTGKSFSVEISIDDNLVSLLETAVSEGTLSIGFKGNENNKLYIENTHISIRVTMPEISVLNHRGNSDVDLEFGRGRYLRINNEGNGNVVVKGKVDQLDLVNDGNGDIHASEFPAAIAEVEKYGNGDVKVNVSDKLSVTAKGNGDIINTGKAFFLVKSKSGNGDLIRKN